jgi:3'-phosphoadenosine 5'-phosphosulfate sulfotransferase (PAPS reductase)/FAD synthetase
MINKVSYSDLKQRQSLSLDSKIIKSKEAIRNFYEAMDGKVYVAFSGGKDSTVLLHLVRSIYPDIPAVFSDTGLEFPEIKEFIKSTLNIRILKPDMNFREVLKEYGYPISSKKVAHELEMFCHPTKGNRMSRYFYLTGKKQYGTKNFTNIKTSNQFVIPMKWKKLFLNNYNNFEDIDEVTWKPNFLVSDKCCNIMKKNPFIKYEQETKLHPYIGILAEDSGTRRSLYLKNGCNSFGNGDKKVHSWPLGFWKTEDIWEYIKRFDVKYCNIYDKGTTNTGCIFCMFGINFDGDPNRFQRLKITHPKLWDYCINNLGLKLPLDYLKIKYE